MGDSQLGSDAPARPDGIRHGPIMDFALEYALLAAWNQALINAQGMAAASFLCSF